MLSTRSAWLSPSRPCAASARARASRSPTRCSSGASVGQEPQRRAQPAGGAGRSAQQSRHPGLREHRHRLRVTGAGGELDVVRSRGRRRPARGEALRRARVRAEQPAAGRALVHRAAHERVAEAEPPRHVGGADEARRPAARRTRPWPRPPRRPRRRWRRRPRTGRRSPRRLGASAASAAASRVELLRERSQDRAGHARGIGAAGRVRRAVRTERVARGRTGCRPSRCRAARARVAPTSSAAASRDSPVSAIRCRSPLRSARSSAVRRRSESWRGRAASTSRTAAPGAGAHQRDHQVDRRGVGPVHVVEHEHQRLRRRQAREQLTDRTVRAVALVVHEPGLAARPPPRGACARARRASRRSGPESLRGSSPATYSSSASTKIQNGRSLSSSDALPRSTRYSRGRRARLASSATRRVLPMPGSPSISSGDGSPRARASSARSTASSSESRPTRRWSTLRVIWPQGRA